MTEKEKPISKMDWKEYLGSRIDMVIESKHEMMGIEEPITTIPFGDYQLQIGKYSDWKFPENRVVHKVLADEDLLFGIMDYTTEYNKQTYYHRFLIGGVHVEGKIYRFCVFHELFHPKFFDT